MVEHGQLYGAKQVLGAVIVPVPSSPATFAPQHCTVPLDSSAHVPWAWAATAMAFEMLDTGTAVVEP
jgi:hypothetical protein